MSSDYWAVEHLSINCEFTAANKIKAQSQLAKCYWNCSPAGPGVTWVQAAHGQPPAQTDSRYRDQSVKAEGIGMPGNPDKGRGLTDVGVGHYYQWSVLMCPLSKGRLTSAIWTETPSVSALETRSLPQQQEGCHFLSVSLSLVQYDASTSLLSLMRPQQTEITMTREQRERRPQWRSKGHKRREER